MISTDDLALIVNWMRTANINDLSVQEGRKHIHLQLAAAQSTKAATPKRHSVKSPGMGRLLTSHPRKPKTGVVIGDHVTADQVVAYLKDGHTLTAITAGTNGIVAEILVKDGDLLGYSIPVLTIEESSES